MNSGVGSVIKKALWLGAVLLTTETCAQVMFPGAEPSDQNAMILNNDPLAQPGILDAFDPEIVIELPGAGADFIRQFETFSEQLTNGDMTSAVAALEDLRPGNPYEDTWWSFARFQLAARLENPAAQLWYLLQLFEAAQSIEGLFLLPKELETSSRRVLLQLQIQNNHLREALDTYALMEQKEDGDGVAAFASAAQQIGELATNATSYPVAAELDDEGQWQLALHKRQFYVDEVTGELAEAEIACDEKSQTLAIEPLFGYTLPAALGACVLTFTGEPGTRFVVMQYRD